MAVALLGSQFSGYGLSNLRVSQAGTHSDQRATGSDGRIVLHSHR